jgi:thymidylate kinase
MAEQGRLIVLEGMDDVALGELAASLCHWLREQEVAVEQTREPTYGPAGSQVLLARQGRLQLDAVSLALLHLADRLDHLQRDGGLLSWLDEGRCVVCVHYALSAYAWLWGEVDWAWQQEIDAPCRTPDLTLFVDSVPVKEGALRVAYLEAIGRLQEEGPAVAIVDGGGTPDEVLGVCQRHVADVIQVPGTLWRRTSHGAWHPGHRGAS